LAPIQKIIRKNFVSWKTNDNFAESFCHGLNPVKKDPLLSRSRHNPPPPPPRSRFVSTCGVDKKNHQDGWFLLPAGILHQKGKKLSLFNKFKLKKVLSSYGNSKA
jgi:hypothetical protein